jgi:hypothetical protein
MNYLPQAMVLLESTRKIYPDCDFTVLITDSEYSEIPQLKGVRILHPDNLDIPNSWLAQMRKYYDRVELATSLKPFLLRTLLDDQTESVTFLDPDIKVFGDISEGMELAQNHGIALTPHRLTETKSSYSNSLDFDFLKYGIFNLGYISVGQSAMPMLNWWANRLRWFCTRYPGDFVFTDQKWIDFIPSLFDYKVIKHYGYNVAYWNLDERPLRKVKGKFLSGGQDLTFIHFSQMSGELANGIITKKWEITIGESQNFNESLKLINEITLEYSAELIKYKLELKSFGNVTDNLNIVSNHTKKKLINNSMNSTATPETKGLDSYSQAKIFRSLESMRILFERSYALTGLWEGIRADFERIRRRFH